MKVESSWRIEPCPSVTGVKHDGCNYLAHIICEKCGWIEPDHHCDVHYGTMTPDTHLQAIADAWNRLNDASDFTFGKEELFDTLESVFSDALTEEDS